MKFYLLIILVIIGTAAYGQACIDNVMPTPTITNSGVRPFSIGGSMPEVKSTYDTLILNVGDARCTHEWVFKQRIYRLTYCASWHDEAGCPDNWSNEFQICKKCLRH
jgi:hypothetical protein